MDQDGFSWADSFRSAPGQSGCANSGGVGVIRRQFKDCGAVDSIWFESFVSLMLRWFCSCWKLALLLLICQFLKVQ
ncbi:hypothetical protein [Synechococcus sp. MIT S9508]|uniref:hypothetical protein n=1 Tax=Synechococcus sp. MIT S9508 TaxID=1801629 RepID=UPI00082AD83C